MSEIIISIDAITIGDRARRDLGDIDGLAKSIAAVGLLQLPVITPEGRLVIGERRFEACKRLRWTEIPVRVLDIEAIARGELDENVMRKDFTPSELVEISRAVEEEERRLARDRQRTLNNAPANLAEARKGDARDKVAARIGAKRTTLAKAKAIVEAAEEQPEVFGKLVEDMDRTGRVNGPFRRLKVIRQVEAIRRLPPPLPCGPFGVIVVDPPWPYDVRSADPSHRGRGPRGYPELSIAQICALPIADIAAPDSIVWLWTTNFHMREAFTVLDAWGFRHRTILTWRKDRMGLGLWLRNQTEHCIMAVRGHPIVTLTNQTTLLDGPQRENSRKPDQFFALVESLCPAPPGGYVSLFERYPRPGWVLWGDEAPSDAA